MFNVTAAQLAEIVSYIEANGGVTITANGEIVRKGSACAGVTEAVRFPISELSVETFAAAVASLPAYVTYGAWFYMGEVWIEPTDVLPTRAEAILLGLARGEIAVFDITAGLEVTL